MVLIYTDKSHYVSESRRYLIDLLRPFIPRNRFKEFEIDDSIISLTIDIKKCHFVVLPMAWNYYLVSNQKSKALDLIQLAKLSNKKIKQLELKAAILDGELFEGADGVKRLSDYPTKDEAQATVIQLVLSPAGNVVKSATSPGSNLLGIIKEIESRLKEGNTIDKIA